jgi:hypothetical protein
MKDDHACSGVNSVPDPFWKWTKLEKARLSGLLAEGGGVEKISYLITQLLQGQNNLVPPFLITCPALEESGGTWTCQPQNIPSKRPVQCWNF